MEVQFCLQEGVERPQKRFNASLEEWSEINSYDKLELKNNRQDSNFFAFKTANSVVRG